MILGMARLAGRRFEGAQSSGTDVECGSAVKGYNHVIILFCCGKVATALIQQLLLCKACAVRKWDLSVNLGTKGRAGGGGEAYKAR